MIVTDYYIDVVYFFINKKIALLYGRTVLQRMSKKTSSTVVFLNSILS